mmetsp:Transcript_8069/g.26445  ORF Transcript_8069/g.26445 Transcript_8069/m.26445 type:complete len:203 (-) Transcript_8069:717-1325(-)
MVGRAPLSEPRIHQRNVVAAAHQAAPQIERPRRPVQRHAAGRRVREQGPRLQKRRHALGHAKFVVRQHRIESLLLGPSLGLVDGAGLSGPERGERIQERVEVKRRQVRVLWLDVIQRRVVVRRQLDAARPRVVEVGELHLVLGADLVPDDDLIDVVEFVPIVLVNVRVSEQRLELGPAWDGAVERFGGKEGTLVKQMKVVRI